MVVSYLQRLAWFVGMVLLQVLILNNVSLAGLATPFLYIYPVLKMESDSSRNSLLLWAFFLGLAVDVFSDTLGMNVVATVLLAFLRPLFLRLFIPRDKLDVLVPGVGAMGLAPFFKFAAVSVFVHHAVLLGVEYFSFAHPWQMLSKIVCCTALTLACVMALEGIGKQK